MNSGSAEAAVCLMLSLAEGSGCLGEFGSMLRWETDYHQLRPRNGFLEGGSGRVR